MLIFIEGFIMKSRLNVHSHVPRAYEILIEMEKFIASADVSLQLRELLKIRASQINKCAYCLELHTEEATKAGETAQRIFALSAWEESHHFTEAEKAALAFTEEVTNLSAHGVKDITFDNMKKHYTDAQIAHIIIVIGQINFWNRINVSTQQTYTSGQ